MYKNMFNNVILKLSNHLYRHELTMKRGMKMSGLSKEAKTFIENAEPLQTLHLKNYEEAREIMAAGAPFETELDPIDKTEEEMIKVDKGEMKVRIYTPKGEGPFPIIIYFHGGGWVTGNMDSCHISCHMLCAETEHIVVSVDYRLAPEHPFPIPVQDAYTAFTWVHENARELNGIQTDITVCGDSSGGNLATVTAIAAKENLDLKMNAQILIYPVTDLTMESDSYDQFNRGYGLTKDVMEWCINYYITDKNDTLNPVASPLFADNLTDLPPALIITAGYDILRDEGIRYAHRLEHAGVKVEHINEEGLVHAYFTTPEVFLEQIKQTVKDIDQFLKKINKDQA